MADIPNDSEPTELAAWRELDVVDTTAYSDAFFSDLAADIEDAVDEKAVVPLFRRPLVIAGAVAAVLLVGFWLRPSPDTATPLAGAEGSEEDAVASAADELEDLARSIGRSAATELFDEEIDSAGLFATADWLVVDDDAVPGTFGSLLEQLDDVPGSETDSLFTPL